MVGGPTLYKFGPPGAMQRRAGLVLEQGPGTIHFSQTTGGHQGLWGCPAPWFLARYLRTGTMNNHDMMANVHGEGFYWWQLFTCLVSDGGGSRSRMVLVWLTCIWHFPEVCFHCGTNALIHSPHPLIVSIDMTAVAANICKLMQDAEYTDIYHRCVIMCACVHICVYSYMCVLHCVIYIYVCTSCMYL